jgi:hypothetical protein
MNVTEAVEILREEFPDHSFSVRESNDFMQQQSIEVEAPNQLHSIHLPTSVLDVVSDEDLSDSEFRDVMRSWVKQATQ